jgi:hypothetical protein
MRWTAPSRGGLGVESKSSRDSIPLDLSILSGEDVRLRCGSVSINCAFEWD